MSVEHGQAYIQKPQKISNAHTASFSVVLSIVNTLPTRLDNTASFSVVLSIVNTLPTRLDTPK